MKSTSSFGTWTNGDTTTIDIERLLETRALIQANSGGGKSYALRKLLEVTAGHVQQILIDPEGEYASLREKHDYIVAAASGGDALAHPKTAKLLAIRLLETGASAVLDLYELKAHERHLFVQLFLESLMNAPKSLWHPVLVPIDEAHLFCPEKGQGESVATESVIDLATRGRKRGFALVAATQRIGKFHKSAAAELKNKLIGSTGLDVDVKRAAFELGLSPKEALAVLRGLKPGHFHAFGPAFGQVDPRELTVGKVRTSHPEPGSSKVMAPPPPTAAIKALLAQLADLPKQAEEEARTVDELRNEVRSLKAKVRTLESRPAETKSPHADPEALRAQYLKGYGEGSTHGYQVGWEQYGQHVAAALSSIPKKAQIISDGALPAQRQNSLQRLKTVADTVQPAPRITKAKESHKKAAASDLPAPQQKILDQLAWLENHGLSPAPKETLAAVCGVSPTSGGYFNNLGKLRSAGLIDYPTGGVVAFTDAGRRAANVADDDGREVFEHWLEIVTEPQRKILQVLIDVHPQAIAKDELADSIGVSNTSGGYFNNLGKLRTLGAIDYPTKGFVSLTQYVMP